MTTSIASPCIQVCCIDPEANICLGCYRTLPEIAAWSRISHTERAEIMADLPRRTSQLNPIYLPQTLTPG